MSEPFLFRFKKPCQSPGRNNPDASYEYDANIDMVIDRVVFPHVPAIESDRKPGPMTKKADMEKSDDQKDRRMWQ